MAHTTAAITTGIETASRLLIEACSPPETRGDCVFVLLARPVGYRCLATDVPDAIERLLNRYMDERFGAASPQEQDAFRRLLEFQDPAIYAYLLTELAIPADYQHF